MGANCGSQRVQIHPDPPRLLQGVAAVERLSVRLLQIAPDTGFVPGGQGVAGSNPAVPTGRRVFSNIPMPPPEPTKEPFHREMTLPEAHAHHVPRPPTRAFVNTAEPAKLGSQGVKDRRATPDPAQRPRQLRTPGHHPQRTGSPQARRAPGRRSYGTRAGQNAHARAAPATSDATPTGMRSPLGQTATKVASDTANALLS